MKRGRLLAGTNARVEEEVGLLLEHLPTERFLVGDLRMGKGHTLRGLYFDPALFEARFDTDTDSKMDRNTDHMKYRLASNIVECLSILRRLLRSNLPPNSKESICHGRTVHSRRTESPWNLIYPDIQFLTKHPSKLELDET